MHIEYSQEQMNREAYEFNRKIKYKFVYSLSQDDGHEYCAVQVFYPGTGWRYLELDHLGAWKPVTWPCKFPAEEARKLMKTIPQEQLIVGIYN